MAGHVERAVVGGAGTGSVERASIGVSLRRFEHLIGREVQDSLPADR